MKLGEPHIQPYRSLYQLAYFFSLAMLVIVPVQILVFVTTPFPVSSLDWLQLFQSQPLIGMFHADFFILVNNVLIAVIYLAFYQVMKETNKGLLQVGLLLGFLGIAAYLSSNKTFELWALAEQYRSVSTESDRLVLLAATKALTAGWQGTAFDTYYVLNGITLLIIASLMFKGSDFSKTTASFGLAAGILMCIPSTAGTIGLVFSLLSLIPWYVFTILYARKFRALGKKLGGFE